MTASKRLDVLLKHLKISANKLAVEKLGYKDNVKIYHIRHNRNNFSPKIAKDITDAFPEISYSWLLTGEGSMFREGSGGNVSGDVRVNNGGISGVVGSIGNGNVMQSGNVSISNGGGVGGGTVSNGVGGSDGVLRDQLSACREQLAEKDRQIAALSDRLAEAQAQVGRLIEKM